jgi:DNA-binding XRE family transcriptional regulator
MINTKLIREQRELLEITQTKMAQLLGIARINYRKIETGEHNPSIDTLRKLVHILELNKRPVVDILANK